MENFISINFIYLRKKNHLSRSEFAAKHDVSYGAQGSYEQGVSLPPITLIQKVCKDYNITIDDFINTDLSKLKNKSHYVNEEHEKQYYVNDKTEAIYNKIIEAKEAVIDAKNLQIEELKKREIDIVKTKEDQIIILSKTNEILQTLLNQNTKN
jgi:HTH-type transcriptional regulator/antitoxin PezA